MTWVSLLVSLCTFVCMCVHKHVSIQMRQRWNLSIHFSHLFQTLLSFGSSSQIPYCASSSFVTLQLPLISSLFYPKVFHILVPKH